MTKKILFDIMKCDTLKINTFDIRNIRSNNSNDPKHDEFVYCSVNMDETITVEFKQQGKTTKWSLPKEDNLYVKGGGGWITLNWVVANEDHVRYLYAISQSQIISIQCEDKGKTDKDIVPPTNDPFDGNGLLRLDQPNQVEFFFNGKRL